MPDETQEKSALVKLKDAALDLTELQVLTFTGTVEAVVKTDGAMDWSKLLKEAKTAGAIELVAATKIEIDGDTTLFVAKGAPDALKQAHLDATAAAQQYRQGLVQAFADLLGIK
jgi:hypothetical protein